MEEQLRRVESIITLAKCEATQSEDEDEGRQLWAAAQQRIATLRTATPATANRKKKQQQKKKTTATKKKKKQKDAAEQDSASARDNNGSPRHGTPATGGADRSGAFPDNH